MWEVVQVHDPYFLELHEHKVMNERARAVIDALDKQAEGLSTSEYLELLEDVSSHVDIRITGLHEEEEE